MTGLIIGCIEVYIILSFVYFAFTGLHASYHYFNPIVNYEEWNKLNVFGVLMFTLLINILFAPWAIIYWAIKFFVFVFTVGRR